MRIYYYGEIRKEYSEKLKPTLPIKKKIVRNEI